MCVILQQSYCVFLIDCDEATYILCVGQYFVYEFAGYSGRRNRFIVLQKTSIHNIIWLLCFMETRRFFW